MNAPAGELDPLTTAQQQLYHVAQRLDIPAEFHERSKHPKRVLTVSIPTEMDDGSYRVFSAVGEPGRLTDAAGGAPRPAGGRAAVYLGRLPAAWARR